ncbi:MAG: hypothetical protein E7357_00140 [Clostridiales bacterium]|nr:hypothetical protein [Clostridiales bacterium]
MKRNKLVAFLSFILLTICAVFGFASCKKDDVEEFVEGLYKPTNIVYDGARLTWDKVELAEYYTVSINGGEAKRVNTTLYTYENTEGGEFDVTVSAIVNGSSNAESMHFIPLDTITDITVSEDGVLSWAEIAGAGAYRISVNGEILATDVTETRYETAEGSNRIKVRAVVPEDNSYYSLWSEEKQVYVNSVPTSVNYDGETLSWIGNARSYSVSINGVAETVTGNSYLFDSESRDFAVEIKALGDHVSSYDSKTASETFHYLQAATNLVVENGLLSWAEVENAEGYQIRVNGVVQSQTVADPVYEQLTAGSSIAVEVKPYNESGKYFSVWSEVKDIFILQSPNTSWNADLELDGQANNNFTWDIVNGAIGYTVEIEKDGNVTHYDFPIAQAAFPYEYEEVGTYKVRVKARASIGSDYYDSKYSTAITVERLAAPRAASTSYITSDPTALANGFTVNYTQVTGASGYQLYKDGVLLDGKYSTVLSITDSNVADDSIAAQQEYNYYIRSMGSVQTAAGQTFVTLPCLTANALSFKITVQAMPTDLTMQGFNAQWTGVSGNNGYGVQYNGSVSTATGTSFDLSTLHAGTYDVSVCTKGNGSNTLASNYTAPLALHRLVAPTNIKIAYGEGEGDLTFDAVANAKSYQVFLDESSQALPESAFDNMYQYIRESGTVLHMVAVANYFNDLGTLYYMTSESSPTQQFIRLATPTFPEGALSNNVELVWNAPNNINTAEYTPTYEVYESDVAQTGGVQNATKFGLQYLTGGQSYTFRVKAIGNDSKYLDSEKSTAITVYKLVTPTLTIQNGKYCWQGVANASAYVLEIDGVRVNNDIHVSGTEYSYTPRYTEIGNHSVKLYAVGDGFNNINSDSVNYTQVVKACLAPEIEFSYSSDRFINGGTIDVNIATVSANCTQYQYEIAGESIPSSSLSQSKAIESAGTYYVRVKALGGTFDENEVYYIDSQYAGGNSGYALTLLSPPTVSTFSINSDGAVKWATITGAAGYDYQISLDGGEFGNVCHSGTASLNELITNYRDYTTIKIRVAACGNGENVISSAWIEWLWTNPNK